MTSPDGGNPSAGAYAAPRGVAAALDDAAGIHAGCNRLGGPHPRAMIPPPSGASSSYLRMLVAQSM